MLNHKGTKVLETTRLILRPFKLSDAESVFENWTHDDEVTKFLSWPTHQNIEVTRNVIQMWEREYTKSNAYQWAIEHRENQTVMGSISLLNVDDSKKSAEAGYCISKKYWNQGITSEALNKILEFAFKEIGLEMITARHHIENKASGGVMKKVGMTYDNIVENDCEDNKGNLISCVYYKIVASDLK